MSETGTSRGKMLPPPPRLTLGFFGATAVFTALAIGSGELMFWPALVLSGGAGVLWIAIAAVAMQWLIDIEIARYSMATGESMVVGAARAAPWLGAILLLGAIVPWIWPGWVRSCGQLGSALLGISERPLSAGFLLSCALILAIPQRVYSLVELLQSVMLFFILAGVVILFVVVAATQGGLAGFTEAFLSQRGAINALSDIASRNDAAYFALLGGIVFAGAGGVLNVGYGILVCEKGFGLGAYSPNVAGVARGKGLGGMDRPMFLDESQDNQQKWRRWLTLVRLEHGLLFFIGNVASIIFLSALMFMVFAGVDTGASGVNLLSAVMAKLHATYGYPVAALFAFVGVLVFYTSALGILDLTSRIAASILKVFCGPSSPTVSSWFHVVVWVQTTIGLALIFLDPRQPFWLLATSAVLNTLVMAVYAWTIVWLNRAKLPTFAKTPKVIAVAVVGAGVVYASVFLVTLTKLT